MSDLYDWKKKKSKKKIIKTFFILYSIISAILLRLFISMSFPIRFACAAEHKHAQSNSQESTTEVLSIELHVCSKSKASREHQISCTFEGY